MKVERSTVLPLLVSEDIVKVRQKVRADAADVGMSLISQTKIITAASEIARNTIRYGGGGEVCVEVVRHERRVGVKLVFSDKGPGILDIKRALVDGYTTGGGLGLGLSGAKRLSNEFEIQTEPGRGTRITLIRWK